MHYDAHIKWMNFLTSSLLCLSPALPRLTPQLIMLLCKNSEIAANCYTTWDDRTSDNKPTVMVT